MGQSSKMKREYRMAKFDLQHQLRLALEWLIEDCERTKHESPRFQDRGWYFSATDLERRLRSAAAEFQDNQPYGHYENYGGMGIVRIKIGEKGRYSHNKSLLEVCRDFLMREVRLGKLRADHPAHGGRATTISGMRFRPADWPLTDAEKKSLATPAEERRRKEWIVHWRVSFVPENSGKQWVGGACQAEAVRKAGRPKALLNYSGWRKSQWKRPPADDVSKVTCKKCLAIAAKQAGLSKDALPAAIQDKLLELQQ